MPFPIGKLRVALGSRKQDVRPIRRARLLTGVALNENASTRAMIQTRAGSIAVLTPIKPKRNRKRGTSGTISSVRLQGDDRQARGSDGGSDYGAAVLCDLSPRPLIRIAGHRFPRYYRRALERYRYGMGVYKVDWALDGPVPWQNPLCALAGTVHLGGTLDEVASSERHVWEGGHPARPFVLLSQPTLFDPSRAPQGCHVVWTYCHVPHWSEFDMLPRIEQQIELFAPGFRERVIARATMRPADIESHNANFVGGDIGAGATTLGQLFTRPTWRAYSTPVRGLYICSASTPPGMGVHGMCGYFAAQRVRSDVLRD